MSQRGGKETSDSLDCEGAWHAPRPRQGDGLVSYNQALLLTITVAGTSSR